MKANNYEYVHAVMSGSRMKDYFLIIFVKITMC